jgi:hypothetical protein
LINIIPIILIIIILIVNILIIIFPIIINLIIIILTIPGIIIRITGNRPYRTRGQESSCLSRSRHGRRARP